MSGYRIMFMGLKKEQEDMVKEIVTNGKFIYAVCGTDIIAIPADLYIINPEALDNGEKVMLADYLSQLGGLDEHVIFTDTYDMLEDVKCKDVDRQLFSSTKHLELRMLKHLHQRKKDYDFSKRIADVLRLQKHIIFRPGITTKELATLEETSERTIKRNIETLLMAGAIIEHKKVGSSFVHGNAKGWFSEMPIWEAIL